MKTLTESIQQALNESLEGTLQTLTTNLKDNADNNGILTFNKAIDLGENDACITGIDVTGVYLRLDIMGHTDSIQIKFFSDEVLKDVINELKKIK